MRADRETGADREAGVDREAGAVAGVMMTTLSLKLTMMCRLLMINEIQYGC